MRGIIVDDESVMVRYFLRECEAFPELTIQESFTSSRKALAYAENNPLEIAFLDIKMPGISGIELATKLRELRPDILIVFISAFDYVRESNDIGGDYYLMKPYTAKSMKMMMERINLLALRQKKKVYLQMFGNFTITVDGKPVRLKGKYKELLAFIAMHRGKVVSGQDAFSALWEGKPYCKTQMSMYYHVVRKLRDDLHEYGLDDLLIPTGGGIC